VVRKRILVERKVGVITLLAVGFAAAVVGVPAPGGVEDSQGAGGASARIGPKTVKERFDAPCPSG
jgi:hypothetical protein